MVNEKIALKIFWFTLIIHAWKTWNNGYVCVFNKTCNIYILTWSNIAKFTICVKTIETIRPKLMKQLALNKKRSMEKNVDIHDI